MPGADYFKVRVFSTINPRKGKQFFAQIVSKTNPQHVMETEGPYKTLEEAREAGGKLAKKLQ